MVIMTTPSLVILYFTRSANVNTPLKNKVRICQYVQIFSFKLYKFTTDFELFSCGIRVVFLRFNQNFRLQILFIPGINYLKLIKNTRRTFIDRQAGKMERPCLLLKKNLHNFDSVFMKYTYTLLAGYKITVYNQNVT